MYLKHLCHWPEQQSDFHNPNPEEDYSAGKPLFFAKQRKRHGMGKVHVDMLWPKVKYPYFVIRC